MNDPGDLPDYSFNTPMIIEAPLEFDVLCGSKSTAFNNHPGNHLFRQKVHSCLASYEKARAKQEKMKMNRQIVAFMRAKFNARFLKQNKDGTWAIANEQCIRDKVSHALRYASQQKGKEEQLAANERNKAQHDEHRQERMIGTLAIQDVAFAPSSFETELIELEHSIDDTNDVDSQTLLVDEVHRRQLHILGWMLSKKFKNETALHEESNDEEEQGLHNVFSHSVWKDKCIPLPPLFLQHSTKPSRSLFPLFPTFELSPFRLLTSPVSLSANLPSLALGKYLATSCSVLSLSTIKPSRFI